VTAGPDPAVRAWVEMIMGLPISVHVRSPAGPSASLINVAGVDESVCAAFARLRRAEAMFSTYRPDSVLSQVNRGEIAMRAAPARFRQVLGLAERALDVTDGAFDVRASGTLDLNGIVKGWAAEQASRVLPGCAYLNAGGDIVVRSADRPWRIGIEHPQVDEGLLAVLDIGNAGVATSGSTHRGQHIIDPDTGRTADAVRQATVVGPSLMWADVWATAVVARGSRFFDRADPLARRLVAGGYSALLVDTHEAVWSTANFDVHYTVDQLRPVTRQLG
jgi:thiamine biosynthesis lipoprotein